MTGPWERYRRRDESAQGRPWERYTQATPEPSREQAYNAARDQLVTANPVTRAAMRGVQAFGFGDELAGLMARGSNLFGADLDPRAVGEAERQRVEVSRRERPVSTFIEEGVGSGVLAAPLGAVGGGARAFAAARPLVTAALGGAAAGGLAGAGENNENRLAGAATGAALGGALGPAAVYGGRQIGRAARGLFGAAGRSAPGRAERQLETLVRAASPDDGSGAFIGERAGSRGRELMMDLAQRPGEAGDIVREAAARRQAQRAQRVMSEVQMRTGGRRGVQALADAAEAERAAAPLFNRADASPVQVGDDLRALIRSAESEGVNLTRAQRSAAAANASFDGPAVPGQAVRALIADVEDAAGREFRQGGGNAGRRLSGLARDLRDYLKTQSPEFAEASTIWRGAQQDRRAFDIGRRAFDEGRSRADIESELREFVGGMADMSASERGQFLAGVLDAVERRAASTAGNGNPASRLTRQGVAERLSIVFGSDEGAALAGVLERQNAQAMFDTALSPLSGSQTAVRQGARGALDRLQAGPVRGAAAEIVEFTGSPLQRMRTAAAGGLRGEISEQDATTVARVLSGMSDEELQQFLADIAQRRASAIPYAGTAGSVTGAAVGGAYNRR